MFLRLIISFFAKNAYNLDYLLLKKRLPKINAQIESTSRKHQLNILEKLLISGEDHRFHYHIGFDIIAMIRACRNRIIKNKFEGASTINQQIVRVITNKYEKTLKRKIKEILLATTLCEIVPRKNIPSIYLFIAYYGNNMFCLEDVLKKREVAESDTLSDDLAAEIVAMIKYPIIEKGNQKRITQIELRKRHLLMLYKKHEKKKFFKIYFYPN